MSTNSSKRKSLYQRAISYYKYGVKYWPKEILCTLFGHRDLRVYTHSEICDSPWRHTHNQEIADKLEAFCNYCDRGWYVKNKKGKWVLDN